VCGWRSAWMRCSAYRRRRRLSKAGGSALLMRCLCPTPFICNSLHLQFPSLAIPFICNALRLHCMAYQFANCCCLSKHRTMHQSHISLRQTRHWPHPFYHAEARETFSYQQLLHPEHASVTDNSNSARWRHRAEVLSVFIMLKISHRPLR